MILSMCTNAAALALLASLVPSQSAVTNAPVAPDTIYLGRLARGGGISIVDLNGFGAGTGDPTFLAATPTVEGNSNYPNNPTLALQGALLIPALDRGDSTRTGGSAGVFTLARDSTLDDVLGRGLRVADLMLGGPLDLFANN